MYLKPVYLLFIIFDFSLGGFTLSDGNDFEDLFQSFDESNWRKDLGTRHCGASQSPGGCVWAQNENLRYVDYNSNKGESWKSSELRISVRNDCKEDHCCHTPDSACTAYTSGQVTSKKLYGHGSFTFMMKIGKETKAFEIKSVSFKSVYCEKSPSSDMFPAVLRKPSTIGYCEVENADLGKFSSNRDLCNSPTITASKSRICARYTWIIDIFSPISLSFKAKGKGVDYDTSAIYVGDELAMEGGRRLIQGFRINMGMTGLHKVELFGFEDCCAGSFKDGYNGWNVHRSPPYFLFDGIQVADSSDESDTDPPLDQDMDSPHGETETEASNEGTWGSSPSNIETIHLSDSEHESSTRPPHSFTTMEAWAETTAESTFSALNSPNTDTQQRQYNGQPQYTGDCPVQCLFQRNAAGAGSSTDPFPPAPPMGHIIEQDPPTEDMDCSNCSDDDEPFQFSTEYLWRLQEMVELLSQPNVCEAFSHEDLLYRSLIMRSSMDVVQYDMALQVLMLEEDLLPNNPTNGALLFTIRQIQVMVQDALNRTQRCQDENGTLPPEVVDDLAIVYESLLHVESMLVDSDIGFVEHALESNLTMSNENDEASESAKSDGGSHTSEHDEDMNLYPGLLGLGVRNGPFHDYYSVHTTAEQILTSTSNPDAPGVPSTTYGAFHCFNLQRMAKDVANVIFEKIGMCLSSINSRQAVIFLTIGQRGFREKVQLPFDAARKIGRFRIEWLPDRIIWTADDTQIGSINKKATSIPDGLMHMKFYSAPQNPKNAPQDLLIEQTMRLFSVEYRKFNSKDELRLIAHEPASTKHIFLLVMFFVGLVLASLMISRWRIKSQIPTGYSVLNDGGEQHCEAI